MKVSLNWLNDYIKITKKTEELVKEIKLHSTDVESVEKGGYEINNVVVGEIKEILPLQNVDNLVICKIDVGNEIKTIVTGDLTVKVGEKVPVALPGATLKEGVEINERIFKGILSEGMMCSLKELGISSDADRIYRIVDDVRVGTNFIDFFGICDEILEVEILPNRPDLLSYLGIARELKTIGCGEDFSIPQYIEITKGNGFPVKIEYDKCNRYMASVVKNVKVGPSPTWLVKKLGRSGVRSINNVVDITNLVMLETGHPIHAFDLNLIGDQIVVRKANKGEKVLLLDGKEYEMNGEETLITDGKNILALGGIMGGELSGINENTTDLLLEVAHFDPVNIRRTSSYHKITSESSYRFERGVDPNDSEMVMGRLVKLIKELSGGVPEAYTTDVYPNSIKNKTIFLRENYLNERLGKNLPREIVEDILSRLEFNFSSKDTGWEVSVPTRRPDITQEIDLVEEVGRIYGYSKIAANFPSLKGFFGSKGDFVYFKEKVSELMLANGYHEAKTFPLNNISKMWMEKEETVNLKIINPISNEMEYMSPKLIYGLLDSASFNYRNQRRNVKLFEIDKVFLEDKNSETGAKELTNLSFIAIGRENEDDYTDKRDVSFYTIKGALENILNEFNINLDYRRSNRKGLMYAQSSELFLNERLIGFLGLLDPQIADENYEIKEPVYICEINLDELFHNKRESNREFRKKDFPSIKREYSLVVPIGIEFKEIQNIIENAGDIIESFKIFDVFKGKHLDKNKISITVSIVYRSQIKTLTEEEVNKVEKNILEQLKNKEIKLREN
ncbi:phenylalanyl-tRNA synthetase subunit beta [Petrotoga sp. 9PW.55.5.1]|uniref:phenylalanine--tRNA ligase subunit beta n=1 Tax=Petrotoga sp. 9PW.55.5.1 TaxID=1308979 RepID=UPI000DC567D0|nr:phenylalanine--tRNA ligase subunit beta [Petrotoga sp. 9PW.55.5.1]RAO99964.1 phenylalanyl-tRNA synthetase subunit beta [Petrotoga sp. 9PW.55.5.1]